MAKLLEFVAVAVLRTIVYAVVLVLSPFWLMSVAYRRRRGLWWGFKSWVGLGRSSNRLAQMLGMEIEELRAFEPQYRRAGIPKRRGGTRILQIPDRATKELQRRIARRVLRGLRAHPAACGFERGKSIVDNARPHVGRAIVIKLDVVDFFGTTTAERVERYLRRIGWKRDPARILTALMTHECGLPQGAPTSPRLSNLINWPLDATITRQCRRKGAVYTRYADDITISLARDHASYARGLTQFVRRALKVYGYQLHLRRKISIRRAHQQQVVTGLVVNEKLQLPRARRRWLRAVAHRVARGGEASLSPQQLQGWLGLLGMIRDQR